MIYRIVRKEIDATELFHRVKEAATRQALAVYPRLKAFVDEADHPLEGAVRLAVAVWKEVGEMRTTLLAGLVVVLLLLSACGTSGAPGELVTEVDDVLGTWHRTKRYRRDPQTYMQLRADGTMGFGVSPDKWDYEWSSHDFAFEGTHFLITETAFRGWGQEAARDRSCAGYPAPNAVYEIQLLANGNLKFVNAQDDCDWRREVLALAEWEAVP